MRAVWLGFRNCNVLLFLIFRQTYTTFLVSIAFLIHLRTL
jgi:hypothetical protein